jgi:hypothetical protein
MAHRPLHLGISAQKAGTLEKKVEGLMNSINFIGPFKSG